MGQTSIRSLLLSSDHLGRREQVVASTLFSLLAVSIAGLVLYGAYYGGITAFLLRSSFFSLVSAAAMMYYASQQAKSTFRLGFYLIALVALIPGPYLWNSYIDIIMRGAMSVQQDTWVFLALAAIVFLFVRLAVGWALVVLMGIAYLYAVYGYLIPGEYGHGGYDINRLTSTLLLSTEGVYGVPMGVAVEYIFLFGLFGAILTKIGTGEVFVDIARGLTGRIQGGPGLSAALSSALLGSLNGSAVANVVTTGTFTIPLMKRVGYSPKLAGAIEAAASSAGQIMPPVMGAAAFLMAEMIGIPYAEVALAALVPALLYILALMVSVRLEAGRLGLERDMEAGWQLLAKTLKSKSYLLLPLIALIGLMIMGKSPTQAAVIGIVVGLLISPWKQATRVNLVDVIASCKETLTNTLPIVAAVASAGVVIGILNLTGMGLMVSGLIIEVGNGSLWGVLLLTALASFILGMGLPTSAAYLLLAVLVAPAMTQLGMETLSAHMFIFYFGLVSAITPPVALAAYAAATISGADANETAVESMRLGFVKLLVPFLFVTMPGILLIGDSVSVVMAITLATFATVSMSIGFSGWCYAPLSLLQRLGFVVAAVMIAWPVPAANFDTLTVLIRLLGFVGMGLSFAYLYSRRSREMVTV
ncbi:C4-dicarboxylate ABC transporter permease [Marinomonas piezotolerans]|uniref:C4-dicarboxylate ABC transporter permease n=1 Tax=Marinomonas piezotolerans TaxID=2213058 RepID=A0A370UEH9_9GAMM|nr:TRAP transporter fused permease subunit [Marinomonas piezotolerans]RDL46174.1 C4-dicarboxylate ABC transporter permease [Marinomonas piezotolerans]